MIDLSRLMRHLLIVVAIMVVVVVLVLLSVWMFGTLSDLGPVTAPG